MTAPSRLAPRTTALLDGLLDASVVAFALWTAVYHLALATDMNRDSAVVLWLALLVVTGAAAWWLRAHATADPVSQPVRPHPRWALLTGATGLAAAAAAGTWILEQPGWWAFWAAVVASLAAATALVWRAGPRATGHRAAMAGASAGATAEPVDSRTGDGRDRPGPLAPVAAVLLLAVAFAVLSAFTVRPDADDVFLMNRAQHAEHRSGPFATRDTIFSDEVFRSTRPDGPSTAIEPLVGVTARFSPFTSPTVGYLLLAPAVSALGILALWRLLRTLRASAPALATVAAAVYLALDGTEHASFGNFSFARAWQGKVIFVFVIAPLLWHYALSWSRDRDRRALVGLVAANTAAIGLTSTATFVAPVITVLGALGGAPRLTLRHLGSLAALAVPLGAGIAWAFASDSPPLAPGGGSEAAGATVLAQVAGMPAELEPAGQWYFVFGEGLGMFLGTAAVLLAWLAVRERSSRLVLALAPLAVFLVFLTPWALQGLGDATGARSILWRTIWVIPFPAAIGLVLTAPLLWPRPDARRTAAAVVIPAVVFGSLLALETPVVSTDNRNARFGQLAWKVDPGARAAADRVIELAEPGATVAVPVEVGEVLAITTLDVRAVNPRDAYMRGKHAVAEFRSADRLLLSRAVAAGLEPDETDAFVEALDALGVTVACTRPHLAGSLVEAVLVQVGFQADFTDDQCTYWRRASPGPGGDGVTGG